MSNDVTSQAQQAQEIFTQSMTEAAARFEAAVAEAARLEAAGLEQMATAIDQMAKLQKDTFGYMTQLTSEWRKLTLEATRRAATFGKAG